MYEKFDYDFPLLLNSFETESSMLVFVNCEQNCVQNDQDQKTTLFSLSLGDIRPLFTCC